MEKLFLNDVDTAEVFTTSGSRDRLAELIAEVFTTSGYRDRLAELIEWDPDDLTIETVTEICERYHFVIKCNGDYVANFSLVAMPGCCGIVVSTGAGVMPRYREKGVGTLLNQFRIELAQAAGYGAMICTDVVQNRPQQRILLNNGWEEVFTFTNPRTDNIVAIHAINV